MGVMTFSNWQIAAMRLLFSAQRRNGFCAMTGSLQALGCVRHGMTCLCCGKRAMIRFAYLPRHVIALTTKICKSLSIRHFANDDVCLR